MGCRLSTWNLSIRRPEGRLEGSEVWTDGRGLDAGAAGAWTTARRPVGRRAASLRGGGSRTLGRTVPDEIVPQRCVVVLPSTGEFDSRTYRIARTLHERGHQVTVLARWKPGLARQEIHPVGYPILRVEATAIDGLPVPAVTLPVLRTLRLAARPILGPPAAPPRPEAPARPRIRQDRADPLTELVAAGIRTR